MRDIVQDKLIESRVIIYLILIIFNVAALAKSECFIFKGGSCQNGNGDYLTSLGISNFLFSGHFVNQTAYQYSSFGYQHHLYYCVDGGTVAVLRGILALVILSTLCTLVAFVMDLIGPKQRHMMIVRRNGILNILAVFILITVCGICYWAALLLYDNLHAHKRAKGSKVLVDFGVSYYILVGSAVANIIATACNLLRRYPPMTIETDREPIINDVDNAILGNEPVVPPSLMVREPPPYAP